MLTIRIIARDGSEAVHEAVNVFMNTREQSRLMTKLVYFFQPGETVAREITEGDIYVMNDYGKTIADYHIMPPKD